MPMAPLSQAFRHSAKMLIGSRIARAGLASGRRAASSPETGVRTLFAADDAQAPGRQEAPIFILSAGWRSGSTLLQRLICSGENVLLWGEPYDRINLVPSIVRGLAAFGEDWPPEGYIKPSADLDLAASWTANLYPPRDALINGYRAQMMASFAEPASAIGAARWGLKEVRFGLAEAVFLQALFPEAKFLFIRRDLHAAYRSYRGFSGGMGWFANWPDAPVFTPYAFAKHWAKLYREVETAATQTGGILIEYEDLIRGQTDLDALGRYCGITIDGAVLNVKVGSAEEKRGTEGLSLVETTLLRLGRRAGQRA